MNILVILEQYYNLEYRQSHWICYIVSVPSTPSYVPQGETAIFFTRRCVIEQWWLWLGPLVLPLGVLWLNGTADYPLLGFLTLGFVSEAPRG